MSPNRWKASLCVLALSLAAAAQTVTSVGGQPALVDEDSNIRVTLTTDFDGSQVLRFTGVNSCSQGPKQPQKPMKEFVPTPTAANTW